MRTGHQSATQLFAVRNYSRRRWRKTGRNRSNWRQTGQMTLAKDDFDAMCVASFSWAFATLGAGSYSEFLDVGGLLNLVEPSPKWQHRINNTTHGDVPSSSWHDIMNHHIIIIICDPRLPSPRFAGHLDEPLLEVVALAVEKRVSSCKTQDNWYCSTFSIQFLQACHRIWWFGGRGKWILWLSLQSSLRWKELSNLVWAFATLTVRTHLKWLFYAKSLLCHLTQYTNLPILSNISKGLCDLFCSSHWLEIYTGACRSWSQRVVLVTSIPTWRSTTISASLRFKL